jgi:hypothetical protein
LERYGIEIGGALGKFAARPGARPHCYASQQSNVMLLLAALGDLLQEHWPWGGGRALDEGLAAAGAVYAGH